MRYEVTDRQKRTTDYIKKGLEDYNLGLETHGVKKTQGIGCVTKRREKHHGIGIQVSGAR